MQEKYDEKGIQTTSYKYGSYGTINDIGFTYNGELKEESGLIYLRARYYKPEYGIFISKDTYKGEVINPLTQNEYIYALNNPNKYIDPSGNISILGTLFAKKTTSSKAVSKTSSITAIKATNITNKNTCMVSETPTTVTSSASLVNGKTSKTTPLANKTPIVIQACPVDENIKIAAINKASMVLPAGTLAGKALLDWLDGPLPIMDVITTTALILLAAHAYNQVKEVSDKNNDEQKKDKKEDSHKYSIYILVDDALVVYYVGRTSNTSSAKSRHHANPARKNLNFSEINNGLSYIESRAFEQYYIEHYKTLNKANPANNQINGVGKKNYDYYMDFDKNRLEETYIGGTY